MATGNYLVDFVRTTDGKGGFAGSYTFPTTQKQLRDNFSDMVPRTVRVPGVDGGFDQFSTDKAPAEIGNVSVTFDVLVDDPEQLQAARDDIREMAAFGVATLTKQCGALGERYCEARVNSIVMTEAPNEAIEGRLKLVVTVDFQVANPYWLDDGTWGAAETYSGVDIGVGESTPPYMRLDAGSGVGGLFATFPRLTVTRSSGNITGFGIQWHSEENEGNEQPFASMDLSMTGFSTDQIVIDCNDMSIALGSGTPTDGFQYVTFYRYPNFVRLLPGGVNKNWFRISVVGATGPAVAFEWRERH